jgi:hypothetical protein
MSKREAPRCFDGIVVGGLLERFADQIIDNPERQ